MVRHRQVIIYQEPMTLHLIKLSVGPESLDDLMQWQTQRLAAQKKLKQPQELMHVTRHRPKRAEELLDGGSIYWVIKGWIVARQKLLDFREVEKDGVTHCGLIYAPEMINVRWTPRRPFQGWRYLDGKDAPPDREGGEGGEDEMPEHLRRELSALGLL